MVSRSTLRARHGRDTTILTLSEQALAVEPSATLAISAKAKEMAAAGESVVSFGAGEPDFDTPDRIKDAAKRALDEGFTKYTAAAGIPDLKKAIAERFEQSHGLAYAPTQVIVSCGGKHSLYTALRTICNPGDEVILAAPYWVSYPELVKLAGGVPVILPTTAEQNYTLSADQIRAAVTSKTKALIVNSPSNPTGTMYEREQLEAIADVALESQFFVVSDEIYEEFVFDGRTFDSIVTLRPDMEQQTLVVNGCSKTYSMTGWRIGWTLGPPEVIKAMGNMQSQTTANPNSIAQKAAVEALTGPQDDVATMRAAFQERRDVICDLLDGIPEVTYPRPQGAFYVFPSFAGHFGRTLGGHTIENGQDLATYLLESVKVAVVPGDASGDPNCVRLSFATSMENIEEGLKRIKSAVA